MLQAVKAEIRKEHPEQAIKGNRPFSKEHFKEIMADGCLLVSADKTEMRYPKDLAHFLFDYSTTTSASGNTGGSPVPNVVRTSQIRARCEDARVADGVLTTVLDLSVRVPLGVAVSLLQCATPDDQGAAAADMVCSRSQCHNETMGVQTEKVEARRASTASCVSSIEARRVGAVDGRAERQRGRDASRM